MRTNQTLWPRRWLMTDERLGDRLWEAVGRLPGGGGIILRHYGLNDPRRLQLGLDLAERACERGLLLGVAGSRALAGQIGADLVHNPEDSGDLPCSMAVHDEAEADAARKMCASLAFIGPLFPTQSHPGTPGLGVERAAELARRTNSLAIALGGMNEERFARLQSAQPDLFHGFAGIDCWLG